MFDPILLAIIGAVLTWAVILKRRLARIEERLEKLEKTHGKRR